MKYQVDLRDLGILKNWVQIDSAIKFVDCSKSNTFHSFSEKPSVFEALIEVIQELFSSSWVIKPNVEKAYEAWLSQRLSLA